MTPMSTLVASAVTRVSQRTRAVVAWGVVMWAVALASCGAVALQMRPLGASLAAADLRAVAFADRAAFITGLAVVVITLVGLALLARWIHAAWEAAQALGVRHLPMTASRAAWGFVLPVVQLWTPWRAVDGITAALDLALSTTPPPRAATDAAGHYRANAAEPSLDAPRMHTVPFSVAWALWWIGQGASFAVTLSRSGLSTTAAVQKSLSLDAGAQLCLAFAALLLARVAASVGARLVALSERHAEEVSS
jgi:Domain of unknown function (DUF4328)